MNDALMRANECHSRLMPLLPGIYYLLQHNGHWEVVSVTEQSNTLFGYTQSEVDELSEDLFKKLIYPDDYIFLREQKYSAMHEGKLYVSEYRMYTKQREIKYVRDQYTCYQKNGQWLMEGYVCETKPSEIREKLLQQLRAYRSAVDYNMISSITDLKGIILYANENFCKISQYSREELIGKNHRIINSGNHSKSFFENLWSTISRGGPWHGEICNRAKDGTIYWVDTVIMPIFDERKKIVNYLSLRLLINDRKEAEQHRQDYTKVLEKIAFALAHEVRSPVCSILGLVDILLHYENDKKEYEITLKHLGFATNQLNILTQKMSEFLHNAEQELRPSEE